MVGEGLGEVVLDAGGYLHAEFVEEVVGMACTMEGNY